MLLRAHLWSLAATLVLTPSVSAQVANARGALGQICGIKFHDLNGNGTRDSGEPALPGWTIHIAGAFTGSRVTDEKGGFCWNELKPGDYKVSEVQQAGWTQTAPSSGSHAITLGSGQSWLNADFGNRRGGGEEKPARICGIKFNDVNGNGVRDANEPGLADWQIVLDGVGSGTTTTDKSGTYCFGPLKPGDHKVSEVQQAGWTQTAPPSGSYGVNLTAGQSLTGLDFGNRRGGGEEKPARICGIKFNDVNGNGVRDANEAGLPDWQIVLDGVGNGTMTTDKSGTYCFGPLKPGDYKVSEVQQAGWTQTAPSTGSYIFNLTAGQSLTELDFGNRRSGEKPDVCVNGYAWSPLGAGVNGEVWALATMGSDLYVGGNFTTAGGAAANYVAKWNGSNWTALGMGSENGTSGPVHALATVGSDLYAGGYFTTAGGIPALNVAKWDGVSWSPLGAGLNSPGSIEAMAVLGNRLFVGAPWVVTSGSMTANSIAAWDLSTSTWSAVGSGTNNRVNSLAVIGNLLYAGGEFTTAGGVSANYIAAWNGSTWSPLSSGMNTRVGGGMGVHNGELYPGGTFMTAGGIPANRITRWDANGGTFTALGSGMNNGVEGFASMGGDLYVSGEFTSADGVSALRVARWDGTAFSPLGAGMNDGVWRLASIGNSLFAGGVFTEADNQPASRIAQWACK